MKYKIQNRSQTNSQSCVPLMNVFRDRFSCSPSTCDRTNLTHIYSFLYFTYFMYSFTIHKLGKTSAPSYPGLRNTIMDAKYRVAALFCCC